MEGPEKGRWGSLGKVRRRAEDEIFQDFALLCLLDVDHTLVSTALRYLDQYSDICIPPPTAPLPGLGYEPPASLLRVSLDHEVFPREHLH